MSRLEDLEEQVALLTDLLAESQFRERIGNIENWIEDFERGCEEAEKEMAAMQEVEFVPAIDLLRDKKQDN